VFGELNNGRQRQRNFDVRNLTSGQQRCAQLPIQQRYGRVEVPVAVLEAAKRDFFAERISDQLTVQTIKTYFDEEKYVVDPHSAVGLAAARIVAAQNSTNTYQIVLSTAHPAKFSEAVSQALGQNSDFNFEKDVLPQEFKGLLEKERRVLNVEKPDIALVKKVIDEYESAA